jgi:hypothetical protein
MESDISKRKVSKRKAPTYGRRPSRRKPGAGRGPIGPTSTEGYGVFRSTPYDMGAGTSPETGPYSGRGPIGPTPAGLSLATGSGEPTSTEGYGVFPSTAPDMSLGTAPQTGPYSGRGPIGPTPSGPSPETGRYSASRE